MPLLNYLHEHVWAHLPKTANKKHVLWAAGLYPGALLLLSWRLHHKAIARGDEHAVGWIICIILAVVLGVALITPGLGGRVYLTILRIAGIFGFFIGRIGLSIVFYLVVTPMGLVMRMTGKDLLDQKFRSGKPPEWRPHTGKSDPRQYFRLF